MQTVKKSFIAILSDREVTGESEESKTVRRIIEDLAHFER